MTDGFGRRLSRRTLLRGAAGLAGAAALPAVLVSCDSGTTASAAAQASRRSASPQSAASPGPVATDAATPAPVGTVTLGAQVNPQADLPSILAEFTAQTGIAVNLNSLNIGSAGDTIQTYLTTTPEDVLMWTTGNLMREVARSDLLEPIDDVWAAVGRAFPDALKAASTGDDGRLYAIPWNQSPWAVFYRKSLFADRGYDIPATWSDYLELARHMRRDGIAPMAFGDVEAWPGLGVFDILNLRLNGYAFHVDLLAGRERWTDRRLRGVFDHFGELLTTTQPDPAGHDWAAAATSLADGTAGMLYMGAFVATAFQSEVVADLGVFPFPDLGSAYDVEKSVEDPWDGFVVPRNSPDHAADLDNAKALLEFFSTSAVQSALNATAGGGGTLPAVTGPDVVTSPLQEALAAIAGAARHATQFLDRDTNFEFGDAFGTLLKDYVTEPTQSVERLLDRAQSAWDAAS